VFPHPCPVSAFSVELDSDIGPVTLARKLQVPRTVLFSFHQIQHSLFFYYYLVYKNVASYKKIII
jgi:hypothetical protein